MEALEKITIENNQISSEFRELAETEETRLAVITSIFIRYNNEMRLKNIQDIRKDISYGAKSYGQLPDVYANSLDSIVKSYVSETNSFMKIYNDEFKNIQDILKDAEEKQKYYFYKIREALLMKNICRLAGKNKDEYIEINREIKKYKMKLVAYEEVILKCDEQFEECRNRRDQDFKDVFEVKQEQALVVVQKDSFFNRIITKIKNKFKGYENFSKYFLQKHISKINKIKTETIELYKNKEKQNQIEFSNKIKLIIANS